MLKSFLIGGCMVNSWVMLSFESPQWLVVFLIIQTTMVVVLIGVLKSVWFSYVLFLVFLGGLLIIFTYVGGLTTKMKLEYYLDKYFFIGVSGLIGLTGVNAYICEINISEKEILILSSENLLSGLGFQSSNFTYGYTVVYLLLTLFCVCWIIKVQEGPLRLLK